MDNVVDVVRAVDALSEPNGRTWIMFALADVVLTSIEHPFYGCWPVSQIVHVLYDDVGRFPDPRLGEGAVYFRDEIGPLLRLAEELEPMLDSVKSDKWDDSLPVAPKWPQVAAAAARALAVMVRNSAETTLD